MRKWINLCESAEELDEGKFKDASLALALGATTLANSMTGGKTEEPKPEHQTEVPAYYVYDDEAARLGLSDLDQVEQELDADGIALANAAAEKSPEKPPQEQRAQRGPSKEAIRLLALTMWGEARSDGPEAMRAVGHVIMNRIKSERKFGRNIKEVVWKRKAFSCWNPSDPNRQAMMDIGSLPEDSLDRKRYKQALKIAKRILAGDRDPTNGALFYHTKAIKPYWVDSTTRPVANINSHLFYRNDAKSG